jgi:hypothetical protein
LESQVGEPGFFFAIILVKRDKLNFNIDTFLLRNTKILTNIKIDEVEAVIPE